MTKPSPVAIDQARRLQALVDQFIAGKLWGEGERMDAKVLVKLLNEHSLAAERLRRCPPPAPDGRTLTERLAVATKRARAA